MNFQKIIDSKRKEKILNVIRKNIRNPKKKEKDLDELLDKPSTDVDIVVALGLKPNAAASLCEIKFGFWSSQTGST